MPRIFPRFSAAAALYNLPLYASGRPTNTIASISAVNFAIFINSFFASRSSFSCKNRSPQVYPVIHNSGRTITFAPSSAASLIAWQITFALYPVSATLIFGVTAATFTNPCLILSSFPVTFYLTFYFAERISFNSSTSK